MPICARWKTVGTYGPVELRQVLSEPPWFDVFYYGNHWFGTLNFALAFSALTLSAEALRVRPLPLPARPDDPQQ